MSSHLLISDAYVVIEDSYRWPDANEHRAIALIGCLIDLQGPPPPLTVMVRNCVFASDDPETIDLLMGMETCCVMSQTIVDHWDVIRREANDRLVILR